MTPKNWTPSWRSFQQTGNQDDIISVPIVAAALGQKVDSMDRQASDLLHSAVPTAIATLNGNKGVPDGSISSISILPDTSSASAGTGIVRVDVIDGDHSDYGRAIEFTRLATLSSILRNWAQEAQKNSRNLNTGISLP